MLESAELGHRVKKSDYRREEPKLREALLAAQYRVLEKKAFPVLVLVNGVDGAGKGETVNLLNEWMDPRHIRTEPFREPTDEESGRPEMWRFWRCLPPKGKIGILFGSWYSVPILRQVMGHDKRRELERSLERIRRFEQMLVAEGAVIVKLWFHLSKDAQRKRLRTLAADPSTAWRVAPGERKRFRHSAEFNRVCEHTLSVTSSAEAPWEVIDGSNAEYRSLTAGRLLLAALTRRLDRPAPAPPPCALRSGPASDGRAVLDAADYSRTLTRSAYQRKLAKYQGRLNLLTRDKGMRERTLVVVFEGMDAAGKGSTIRRVTQALDARFYRVIPVGAPNEEERAQPYLWRFWIHIPRPGHAVIFDRSWYGRVLVERVEGFCSEADWRRAYQEIGEFEEQLVESGAIVQKFWLAVTPQEQLRRFEERTNTSYKRFKITAEDWRNREKWPAYESAVAEMIGRTSSEVAPWNVVASDDKLFARIEVLKRLCGALEAAL